MLGYVRKTGFYILNMLLGGLTSLLIIPVVILVVGTDSWGRMAVAQAIGAVFAVFVGFGWGIVGPAQVAGMDAALRGQFLRDSVVSRFILLLIAIPLYVATVILILGVRPDLAAYLVAGFTMMTVALGSGWFFIGESAPVRLILWEALPRTIGVVIALGALAITKSLVVFAVIQLATVAASILLTTRDITARYVEGIYDRSIREGLRRLKGSYAAMVTAGTATLYVNAPLIIVTTVIPSVTPIYAAAEKIQRFALTGIAPLTQIIQGYIPSAPDQAQVHQRIRRSIIVTSAVALAFGAVIAGALPWIASILTAGKIAVPFGLSIPMGISSLLIIVSGVTGLAALVALGKERALAVSTVLGAVIGLPLTVALAMTAGMEGAAWAVTFSEVIVLGYQLIVLRSTIRQRSLDDEG
jgi:O-antigen/teichoic acid export membrane protein